VILRLPLRFGHWMLVGSTWSLEMSKLVPQEALLAWGSAPPAFSFGARIAPKESLVRVGRRQSSVFGQRDHGKISVDQGLFLHQTA
jgi:hypothetical protein